MQRHIQEERFRKASTFNVKATIDGVPVGLAVWHAAPDRTATRGEPTNADRAESDEKNAALKALSEDFKEYSDSMDFAFLGRFKGAMEEARKGHYRGKPHWHLVSPSSPPSPLPRGIVDALIRILSVNAFCQA